MFRRLVEALWKQEGAQFRAGRSPATCRLGLVSRAAASPSIADTAVPRSLLLTPVAYLTPPSRLELFRRGQTSRPIQSLPFNRASPHCSR